MNVKIGYQTIIWGPIIENLERCLDIIALAGYKGVEFAQHPKYLGDITKLTRLLAERNLSFLGLAGGSIQERIEFCGNTKPHYLYTNTCDSHMINQVTFNGHTLALHPYIYSSTHRLSGALNLLKEFESLKFLPDTAHMTIAGDNFKELVKKTREHIIGIHLKDWSVRFGRSPFRYARGFTELGKGNVDFSLIFKSLENINYNGWLIVEQDRTDFDPITSIVECASWLKKKQFDIHPNERGIKEIQEDQNRKVFSAPDCSPKVEVDFLRGILNSRFQGIEYFFENLAEAFNTVIPSTFIKIWSCSPSNSILNLLVFWPIKEYITTRNTLNAEEVITGLTIEKKVVWKYDLSKKKESRSFGHPELLPLLQKKEMISIPLLNPDNADHVQYVINIFPKHKKSTISENTLFSFGITASLAAQSVLDELCLSAAGYVNEIASKADKCNTFWRELIQIIQSNINCQGITIFLVNEATNKLEPVISTGIEWNDSEKMYYEKGEGLTGSIWDLGETIIIPDVRKDPRFLMRSFEKVTDNSTWNYLISSIIDFKGKVIGLIRCRNKSKGYTPGKLNVFNDIDIAVIDSIFQAAIPHLNILLADERRAKAMGRLIHELKVPITAIRSATQTMREELNYRKHFSYDYIGDIWSWTELMRRLFGTTDIFRYRYENIKTQRRWTYLLKDVVAPAIRQVKPLLMEREFLPSAIRYDGFHNIPKIFIDTNLFQQVVFNLLSNAIKYCYDDPNSFQVEIIALHEGSKFLILFRDYGIGIDRDLKELIFEEGFRSAAATEKYVAGQGLGLWVVKEILLAHNASITLTNEKFPTEFTISLGENLAES
ncbi:GAF domain-containing protein [candidate division KSB1 bacterium]|nr:GAF domain-containing protein [candidate division KSB1 bacterium]